TTYTDQNLLNGIYSYYVVANYSSGSSTPSNTYSPTVRVPYQPQNAAVSVTNDNVMITWNAPADTNLLTGYRVLRDGVVIFEDNSLFYLDQDLANADYVYTVRSVYGPAISNPSSAGTAHVEVHYVPGPTQANVNLSTVNLSWAAVTDAGFFQNYRIYRNGTQIGTATTLNYSDTGLANGTYSYTVSAMYQNGESAQNTAASGTVDVAYSPNNLAATWEGSTVTLTWLPPTDLLGFVEYKVYRNGLLLSTTSNLTFTDLNVGNGMQDYFVGALYTNGITAPSNHATANILVAYPPQNLAGDVDHETGYINLNWQDPTDIVGVTAFKLYRNDVLITNLSANDHYYADNPINGEYSYQVVATYGTLDSQPSNTVVITLIVPQAATFTGYSIDANDLTVNWQAPENTFGLVEYRVYNTDVLLGSTTQTSIIFPDLPNGVYDLRLMTVYESDSIMSPDPLAVTLIYPYPVQNLIVTTTAGSSDVTLTWEQPQDYTYLSRYLISRNGSSIGEIYPDTTFIDHDVANGDYTYSVVAAYGEAVSEEVTVTCQVHVAAPARNVVATKLVAGNFRIEWEAPEALSAPDYYDVFFLIDGEQDNPTAWTLAGVADSTLTLLDPVHGELDTGNFLWAVTAVWLGGEGIPAFSNILHVGTILPPIPEVTKLLGNYPNPFNPETRIVFQLKQDAPVKLQIYNDKGQLVKNLLNTDLTAGEYSIPWDGRNSDGKQVNSGLYIYKLITTGYTHSGKMMLLK
ncbi:MAG TPA: FlgD immunoglobulin-like domain containing protein, partial [Candidatus Cloacimonadota bacterium]|nr:FlgD immunoglobulin-like domain containing protein [Candidatus Cloacimonadota bacterium]